MTETTSPPVGRLLRGWRERRRLTQLRLASEVGVSTRHLSYIETGRSRPTPEMLLRLAEHLDVPLRERNTLLLAAGHAPTYPHRSLADTPMAAVSDAIDRILEAHLPYPAVVVDHHWDMVAGNDAVALLTEGAAGHLLEPPVNVLRLSLHPDGLAPRILNLGQWRAHLLDRLRREVATTGDTATEALLGELVGYPGGEDDTHDTSALLVPLTVLAGDTVLSLFSTTTVFGTPRDVTVSEIAIESFHPSDAVTREFFDRAVRRR
ncbi:helix-turn-helix transcriptional regulator [Rhodococcus triatomae]|uniref:Transcriptional regulator, contains XRE-family HTH domain n=1 Tax=Rhodococcus triatomae TaxID=300028 RepID=A0A1G8SE09_9NOCA|nr:helix-turn-helix transcriptional regulator [Rhodococcus triatomae]QNG20715.1 helix-turn-helix transcriptional regulator [Rhodococcus triatomae]QNG23367.1 helix-turn-helix transcriptional regulator [Rhodococcus triatomae]SDJ27458.1 Transcriptional regulator, contains XRE-family HTH domain [Rhodococcus triatomae]